MKGGVREGDQGLLGLALVVEWHTTVAVAGVPISRVAQLVIATAEHINMSGGAATDPRPHTPPIARRAAATCTGRMSCCVTWRLFL